jgi:hypothetical protein
MATGKLSATFSNWGTSPGSTNPTSSSEATSLREDDLQLSAAQPSASRGRDEVSV